MKPIGVTIRLHYFARHKDMKLTYELILRFTPDKLVCPRVERYNTRGEHGLLMDHGMNIGPNSLGSCDTVSPKKLELR